MKQINWMKKHGLYLLVAALLVCSAAAVFGANSEMPRDASHVTVQVFSPNAVIDVSNGSLTVSSYRAIMFNADVTIQINGSGSTYDWPADVPFGIADGLVTTLTISGLGSATTALVM